MLHPVLRVREFVQNFRRRRDRGAEPADDDAGGDIRKFDGVLKRRADGVGAAERGDNGIAGAGYIEHLAGARRDMQVLPRRSIKLMPSSPRVTNTAPNSSVSAMARALALEFSIVAKASGHLLEVPCDSA